RRWPARGGPAQPDVAAAGGARHDLLQCLPGARAAAQADRGGPAAPASSPGRGAALLRARRRPAADRRGLALLPGGGGAALALAPQALAAQARHSPQFLVTFPQDPLG